MAYGAHRSVYLYSHCICRSINKINDLSKFALLLAVLIYKIANVHKYVCDTEMNVIISVSQMMQLFRYFPSIL